MDFDYTTGLISISIAILSGFVIYFISKITITSYSSYDGIKASRKQEKIRTVNNDRSTEAKKLKKIKKKLKKESSIAAVNLNDDNINDEQVPISTSEKEEMETPSVVLIPQKIYEDKPQIQVSKIKHKVKPNKKTEDQTVVNHKQPDHVYDKVIDSNIIKTESKLINEALTSLENEETNTIDDEGPTLYDLSSKLKKKPKKKKADETGEESEKMTLKTILPLIEKAEFSHGEVQILIDALLNKDNSEWLKGKQDPMFKLKKQLEEMEKVHSDDAETINGLQIKLTSLRSELNAEKSNNKIFKETLAKANNDIQTLSMKFQQVTDEKDSLHMNIQQLKQQLKEEHMMVLKLKEEKLLFSQMNISHEQHHETVVALQAQVAQTNQLAAQLTDLQTHNANLVAQLDNVVRLEEECRQLTALNVDLDHLLNNSQFEVNRLNAELVSLSKQLEDSRSQYNDLSGMFKVIEAQKNELLVDNENLKEEISKAKDARKYQKMADSLEHNLEENKKNGSINFHNTHADCQSKLDEKEVMIKNLNSELNQKEKVVEKLLNEVISCKNDANKKQTLIDNLSVELSSLKSLGAKTTSDLTEERSIATNLQSVLHEKNEIINNLTKDIESYKFRNNELRSKNWKIVEALEKAEASIKDLRSNNPSAVDSSSVEEIKNSINNLIQPLISSSTNANIFNIEDNKIWLDKVGEIIRSVKKETNNVDIVTENSKLQHLVTHYRSVITDLEAMLSDLQLTIETANNEKLSATSFNEVNAD